MTERETGEVVIVVSVDTITLAVRNDGVSWRCERDPVVEPGRSAGVAVDVVAALRAALACT